MPPRAPQTSINHLPSRSDVRPRSSTALGHPGSTRDDASQVQRRKPQRTPSQSEPSHPAPPPTASSMSSDVPRCEVHGLTCTEREVSRDGPNKGRLFYVCPLPHGEQCDFFAWVSSDSGPVVKCPGHDEPCAERTVRKEGPNKGRQFYTCRRSQTDNSCGYFQWKDEIAETPGGSTAPISSRGVSNDAPTCSGHNAPCVLRTTRKSGPNQNREFYSCSFQGTDSCGYFEWKDEMEPQRQRPMSSSPMPPSGPSGGDNEIPRCGCGLTAVLLTCKNGVNKGRTFYKCPNPQGSQCDFFQWGS
ncbi:unnamed protein product [Phytophthora fragariaefolia]|uniref:Unnamed protein product n=1 Tax=Phytophthora fragariaefolia TaxID=1490495 RepID=A0A9W7CNG5_9STRA|nr:unnamed protein product [Phytophthora fragariaefolia]